MTTVIKVDRDSVKREPCIYAIENIQNGKIYIGLTIRTFEERMYEHKKELRQNKHYNAKLQNSYNKYGKDNFIFYILELCSIEETSDLEKKYIKLYDSTNRNKGFNITEGGQISPFGTDAFIEKMSYPTICINTQEIFKSATDASHFYNIHVSAITANCRGELKTAGRHPVTGEKLEWAYYEEGVKYTLKKLKTKRNDKAVKVICRNTQEVFSSIKEASIKYNISKHSISNNCSGRLKSAGKCSVTGFLLQWAYYEEGKEYPYLGEMKKTSNIVRKVKCLTTGEVFNTVTDASIKYPSSKGKISEVCRGKRKSAGKCLVTGEGLRWEYVD